MVGWVTWHDVSLQLWVHKLNLYPILDLQADSVTNLLNFKVYMVRTLENHAHFSDFVIWISQVWFLAHEALIAHNTDLSLMTPCGNYAIIWA